MPQITIPELAQRINDNLSGREIGQLKRERAKRLGQKKYSEKLFAAHGINENWAIHDGGRNELQFNIGGDEWHGKRIRYGVAFSFGTSASLPDNTIFVPKVKRFNQYLGEYPDVFDGLQMWWWLGKSGDETKHAQHALHEIPLELIKKKAFVFVGTSVENKKVKINDILDLFDWLYPLYKFVESKSRAEKATLPVATIHSSNRRPWQDKVKLMTMRTKANVQIIELRHRLIQEKLESILKTRFGRNNVVCELAVDAGRFVDIAVRRRGGSDFYEIKTGDSARQCVREAIGQLLEYAYATQTVRPRRLIVVGEPKIDPGTQKWLKNLNNELSMPIEYLQFGL